MTIGNKPPSASVPKTADMAEGAAITASLLCLVHCLVLPLLLAWAPAFSQHLELPFDLHLWIVLLAGPVSLGILIRAGRRRRPGIMAMGLCGLGLLIAALAFPVSETQETVISSMGSILLACAHLANWLARHPEPFDHG